MKLAKLGSRFLVFSMVIVVAFAVISVNYLLKEATTLNESSIYHNLTRAGWAAPCSDGEITYGYSSLEGYNRSRIENQYQIVTRKCGGDITTTKVLGSAEGRSIFQYDENFLLIGSSLQPRLIRFDQTSGSYSELFKENHRGMWIHQIFADREYAYIKLSMPSAKESLGKTIYKINLQSGDKKKIQFNCEPSSNGYSGIQTVDPKGRIWAYSAYPVKYFWISEASGCDLRQIEQHPEHKVLSWWKWHGEFYYVAVSPSGKFEYLPFERGQKNQVPSHFSGLLPADLFKTAGDRISTEIFVDSTGHTHRCNDRDCRRIKLPFVFSRIEIPHSDSEIRPRGITYFHDRFGLMEMVFAQGNRFIFWLIDSKTFFYLKEGEADFSIIRDSNRNATPANLTSLVSIDASNLLTSGYLTTSTIASVNKSTGKSVEHTGVVPFSQGQVNYLMAEKSGKIVGSVYPDAIYFIYDPFKGWSPGQGDKSNPFNFGPLNNHHQQRTYHGFQDRAGKLWFFSKSDFSQSDVYAITKIDIGLRERSTINTVDHGIPIPLSGTDYDDNHILVIARGQTSVGLYLMSKDNYQFSHISEFPHDAVASTSGLFNGVPYTIITGDREVYYFDRSTGLRKSLVAPAPVLKLAVEGHYVFMIGKKFISMIDLRIPDRLQTRYSWMFGYKEFFSNTHWLPASIDLSAKKFYFANDFKLHSTELDFDWDLK